MVRGYPRSLTFEGTLFILTKTIINMKKNEAIIHESHFKDAKKALPTIGIERFSYYYGVRKVGKIKVHNT